MKYGAYSSNFTDTAVNFKTTPTVAQSPLPKLLYPLSTVLYHFVLQYVGWQKLLPVYSILYFIATCYIYYMTIMCNSCATSLDVSSISPLTPHFPSVVSSGVVVKGKMYDLIADSQQLNPHQFTNTNYSLFGMEQQPDLQNYNTLLHRPIKVGTIVIAK